MQEMSLKALQFEESHKPVKSYNPDNVFKGFKLISDVTKKLQNGGTWVNAWYPFNISNTMASPCDL